MQTSWAHVLHTLPFGPLPVPCQDNLVSRARVNPQAIPPESWKGLLEANVPEVLEQTQPGSQPGLPPSPCPHPTPAAPQQRECAPAQDLAELRRTGQQRGRSASEAQTQG